MYKYSASATIAPAHLNIVTFTSQTKTAIYMIRHVEISIRFRNDRLNNPIAKSCFANDLPPIILSTSPHMCVFLLQFKCPSRTLSMDEKGPTIFSAIYLDVFARVTHFERQQ